MDEPGLRVDPLTGAYVVVTPWRQDRPNLPEGGCPFCPGGLEAPRPYSAVWIPNRWPALLRSPLPELPAVPGDDRGHDDGTQRDIGTAQVDQDREVDREQGGHWVGQRTLAVEHDGEPHRHRQDQEIVGQRVG